jgi:hypothetical protein
MAIGKDETSISTGEVETVKAEVVESVEANGTGTAESSPVIELLSLCKFPEVVERKKKFTRGNFIQPLRN